MGFETLLGVHERCSKDRRSAIGRRSCVGISSVMLRGMKSGLKQNWGEILEVS